ncbi:cytokine-dependent hematopoietic cell linker [Phyllobates terribilis]|uniref:cytokine-dependent hematopoietic cell linker n=1 Tax=Phyllobates terribilis TaxID=111132 RepID=UPI003CCAEDD4
MHRSGHWHMQHEKGKEGNTDDDEDSESYEFIDGDRELPFSAVHISKSNSTSEYADKRCFRTEMNNQTFNSLQLSPSVHQNSRSTIAARPQFPLQMQKSNLKETRSVRDQRMLSVANFKDTIPLPRSTPINYNDCEEHSVWSSSKTWDINSQSARGPAVNRSLKPQKLFCQVNGDVKQSICSRSTSTIPKICKSSGVKSESSLSNQPNTMPTTPRTEKKTESTANRRIDLQSPWDDNSRDSSLTHGHQTSTAPRWKTEADWSSETPTVHRGIKQIQQWPHPLIVAKVPAIGKKTETRHMPYPSVQRCKDSAEDLSLAEQLQRQLQCFDDKTPSPLPEKERWYLNEYDRCKAERVLYQENKDGAFLVRDNSHGTSSEPYVLSVYHDNKVYHIKIRYLEDTRQYALGTGRRGNYKFNSVEDIIEFHKSFPLLLLDGRATSNFQGHQCFLTRPPIMSGRKSSQSL